jgi:two-component system response regulator HydG
MPKSALVVDDDVVVLALTGRWLEDQGYQVTALSDFVQAKERLRAQPFDVLLTDVRLGEFNGLQLAIEARVINPGMRIIVMSGWLDPAVRQDAAGCNAVVLLKPVTPGAILEAVESTEE